MAAERTLYDLWVEANNAERKVNALQHPWQLWKARYEWERCDWVPDREVYRTHSTLDAYEITAPDRFTMVEQWCTGYQQVWASREDHVILTYCEGDLSYEQCRDEADFERAFEVARRFYEGTDQ